VVAVVLVETKAEREIKDAAITATTIAVLKRCFIVFFGFKMIIKRYLECAINRFK
jgi:hypothetical protein